jgi:predicted PurR-regulated permease PerM
MVDTADTAEAVPPSAMPRWIWKAAAIFWLGFLGTIVVRKVVGSLSGLLLLLLVSLFLSLAIEPGVNWLARRGWRRGPATALILFVALVFTIVFVVAIGTLVGQQIADLLSNAEDYVNRVVDFSNDNLGTSIDPNDVIESIRDPEGPVQRFIRNQGDEALALSGAALGFIVQVLTVLLFTFYLVADGPKLRAAICGRLNPERQRRVLHTWELAIDKTGGYLYSRAVLAFLSAVAHWIALTALDTKAPLAMALWVGLMSQFVPVFGTYLAGALPVLLALVDSPVKALIIAGFVVVYQQVENYFLLPRVTSRTMNIHPAVAFGSALAGAAILGAVGAVLAIPAAAMLQALISDLGERHEVIDSHLVGEPPLSPRRASKQFRKARGS